MNSPGNPTGAVWPRSVIEAMADFAIRHDLWLISDECYDQILFEGEHVSPASFLTDGRVISVYTFSKTYSMTGWRLGYGVGEVGVIDTMTKVLESNTSGPSTIAQKAAEAALDGPQDCVAEMVAAYSHRRDLAVDLLDEAGLRNYAVSAGGDMLVRGRAIPDDCWRVGIQHPLELDKVAKVVITNDLPDARIQDAIDAYGGR